MQSAITGAGEDLDGIMRAVAESSLRAVRSAAGALIELRDGDDLVFQVGSGLTQPAEGHRLPMASSLAGRCVRLRKPQICHDVATDHRVDRGACRLLGIRSMILLPLPVRGEIAGVLALVSDRTEAFDGCDMETAQLLVGPIAYGLATAAASMALRTLEATFEQAAVGIAHVAPDGRFVRVNARFCDIAGHPADDLVGNGFQQITHPDDLAKDLALLDQLMVGEIPTYTMEKRYIRQDGCLVWINLTVSLVRAGDGSPDFFVAVIEDISSRKAAETLALFDPLTGLPNRRHAEELLDRLLQEQAGATSTLGVAFLDLDRFKSVNDRFGHAEGDRCLTAIAAAMKNSVRRTDILARLAGDEFVLVMQGCSPAEADMALQRLNREVRRLAVLHGWDVGISAGAVLVPAGHAHSRAEILDASDRLMYAAKRDTKGRIVRYLDPQHEDQDASRPVNLERRRHPDRRRARDS